MKRFCLVSVFVLVSATLSLRADVSTTTALTTPSTTTATAPATEPVAGPKVLCGIDVLESEHFAPLVGKQVGLITNQTGLDAHGRPTADVLARAPGVKLIALFSPEHGIRGQRMAGQVIGDTIDPILHLPVYSLYGSVQRPTPEMLNEIDVLVYDVQDTGARFYTYITTMGMAMEAAKQRNIPMIVLDRPNPAGGERVEGPILDSAFRSFTAYFSIPVRYAMTIGELAAWYNQTGKIGAKLQVIPMQGWKRHDLWSMTWRHFVPPSPNIRTPTQALLYSGVGMFEATNVSVGRGTETPFELVGAPWIDGHALAQRLTDLQLPGFLFEPAVFSPTEDIYTGLRCEGVRIHVTDASLVRTVDLFVQISCALRDKSGSAFIPRWDEIARVTGTHDFETLFKAGKTATDILAAFYQSANQFDKDRKPYLIYP